jgi:hypothetical protein
VLDLKFAWLWDQTPSEFRKRDTRQPLMRATGGIV